MNNDLKIAVKYAKTKIDCLSSSLCIWTSGEHMKRIEQAVRVVSLSLPMENDDDDGQDRSQVREIINTTFYQHSQTRYLY